MKTFRRERERWELRMPFSVPLTVPSARSTPRRLRTRTTPPPPRGRRFQSPQSPPRDHGATRARASVKLSRSRARTMSADAIQDLFGTLEGHIKAESHDDVLEVRRSPRPGRGPPFTAMRARRYGHDGPHRTLPCARATELLRCCAAANALDSTSRPLQAAPQLCNG
eukprot:6026566-Prymnesium_polylepis.1